MARSTNLHENDFYRFRKWTSLKDDYGIEVGRASYIHPMGDNLVLRFIGVITPPSNPPFESKEYPLGWYEGGNGSIVDGKEIDIITPVLGEYDNLIPLNKLGEYKQVKVNIPDSVLADKGTTDKHDWVWDVIDKIE